MFRSRFDPDGLRLPIKVDSTANGEFLPRELGPRAREANANAARRADENARRLGMDRRSFLVSACGAATVLLAWNETFGQDRPAGGAYELPPEAGLDLDAATAALAGREFIFDIQTHHVNPAGAWRSPLATYNLVLRAFPQAACDDGFLSSLFGSVECFSAQHFVKEIFLDSDTDMGVLTFVPALPHGDPLTIAEADETRRLVDALDGDRRLLLHGRVLPNTAGGLDGMDELVERWRVSAFKTYTQFGPDGRGYWLDDPAVGIPFLEKARALGVKLICVHKGLPLAGMTVEHSRCRDVGAAAALFPDLTFIVYHSGFMPDRREGPYDPARPTSGIDDLLASLQAEGIGPTGNVYAELGSTWRFLMRDPTAAAHALGKLLTVLGPDRILWGTDAIWYGSPQDQIQAFRTFQISEALREAHGYPEITPAIRARVFGLNALAPYGLSLDEARKRASSGRIDALRTGYAARPDPSFLTYGPKTRTEHLALWRARRGQA